MEKISWNESATPGLVSIVIPTYNKDKYIGETLESIGRQEYTNWEVIVVEDSSRGETEQIVRNFAAQHPHNRVDYSRNEQNSGAAFSRNVGFKRARGEFIALVDADDRWLPAHLTVSLQELARTGADLVYSTVLMIEDTTEIPIATWGPDALDRVDFPYTLFRRNFITPSATVMRREVISDVGPWGLGFRYCEDADYWFQCVAAGKKFAHVGGCNCLYRKNHEGATTQRLCGTLEEFADIAERYAREIPNLKRSYARKCAAQACLNAADFHFRTRPQNDPSANASRAPVLAIRAWHLRRKNVQHLSLAFKYWRRNLFRSLKQATRAQVSRLFKSAPRSAATSLAASSLPLEQTNKAA